MSTSDGQTTPGPVRRRMLANRYAVHDVLGRGGMGVVWGAEDTVIGRRVAIKELTLPDGIPDAERSVYEERVLREARTTGRLNDPGVVTVYDVLNEGGSTYIVMELIEAPTLADVLRERGPLPQEQVLTIAEEVLAALNTAHAAGIVHRDVKPSNIMLLANGRVKLTDFGIAQALDDARLTTSGALIGSPAFMAPERIAHSAATPASDLWSLGATLFNAVEGYPPFERPNTAATMHAIINNETPQVQRANGILATLVGGLLVAAPEARLNAAGVRALLVAHGAMAYNGAAYHGAAYPGATQNGAGRPTAPMQVPGATMVSGAQPATMIGHRPAPAKRWPLLLGVAVLAAAAGFGAGMLLPGRDAEQPVYTATSYGPGGDLPAFDLSGTSYTCLTDRISPGRGVGESSAVSCDKSHGAEIYVKASVFGTSTDYAYPGRETLISLAAITCKALFGTDRVSAPGKDVSLTYTTVIPTEQQWNSSGSSIDYRDMYCVLSSKDGKPLRQSFVSGN